MRRKKSLEHHVAALIFPLIDFQPLSCTWWVTLFLPLHYTPVGIRSQSEGLKTSVKMQGGI